MAPATAKSSLSDKNQQSSSIDLQEIERFSEIAAFWWDPNGPFRPLHALNPVRLTYLRRSLDKHFQYNARNTRPYQDLSVLDIGCGGGLLSEPLARLGARVTAIDADREAIKVAIHHAEKMGLEIDYRCTSAESLLASGRTFDLIVAMEIIEHVADLTAFSAAVGSLLAPGAALAIGSINRTIKSFAFAIVGAEYILRWLPRGTHDWHKFVRPSEISQLLRANELKVADITGVNLNPLVGAWEESRDTSVNYMLFAIKPPHS